MSISIQKVTKDDAEEILAIYEPYILHTAITFEYEVPSVDEFKSRIQGILEKYPYIKAVDESGQIVGYAYMSSFKGRKAYDWSVETTVYVKEDCKGRGIGKLLYLKLEEIAKDMGILNMNACIGIPKDDEDGDEYLTKDSFYFHEKLGYKLVGTFHHSGYKFQRWYDMIWMEKQIGEHLELQPDVRFGKWTIK